MSNPPKLFDVKIVGLLRDDQGQYHGPERLMELLAQGYEVVVEWQHGLGHTVFLRKPLEGVDEI